MGKKIQAALAKLGDAKVQEKLESFRKNCKDEASNNGKKGCPDTRNSICENLPVKGKRCHLAINKLRGCMKHAGGEKIARCIKRRIGRMLRGKKKGEEAQERQNKKKQERKAKKEDKKKQGGKNGNRKNRSGNKGNK